MESRTRELRSGGRVTLTIDVNILALSVEDREWVFDLIEHLNRYGPSAVRDDGAPPPTAPPPPGFEVFERPHVTGRPKGSKTRPKARPPAAEVRHRLAAIEASGAGYSALCECSWRSPAHPTQGDARGAHHEHINDA